MPDVAATNRRWRHRRRLAYLSLGAAIAEVAAIVALAVTGQAGSLADFNSVVIVSLTGLFSISGAYVGLSSWLGPN